MMMRALERLERLHPNGFVLDRGHVERGVFVLYIAERWVRYVW